MRNEIERQERTEKFVRNNVYCCQSVLVDGLLKKEVFNYDDIENLYKRDEELLDEGYTKEQIYENDCVTVKEIYEWWVVSDWMIEKLRELNEPILENEYGTWWGRCHTGQAIVMDFIIYRMLER